MALNDLTRRDFIKLAGGTAAAAAAPTLPAWAQPQLSVEEYVQKNGQGFMDDFLFPWLRIRSIGPDKTKLAEGKQAAEWLLQELNGSGFDIHPLYESEGSNPIVYAERRVADLNAPTVLIYGHYDVQPIKQPEAWEINGITLDPFEPQIIDGRIYARGAADDKGQIASHLFALRYLSENGFPNVNIKFVAEGNEEGGGSHIDAFIKQNKELLAADTVLISDLETLIEGQPALTKSLRGIVRAELESDDPYKIVSMLHKSHDPITNHTQLDRFYDGVEEQHLDDTLQNALDGQLEDMGPLKPERDGDVQYSQLENRWFRPANNPLLLKYANPEPEERSGYTFKIAAQGPKQTLHSGGFGGPVQVPALYLAHLIAGLHEKGIEFDIDYLDYSSRPTSSAVLPYGEAQITTHSWKFVKEAIDDIAGEFELFKELISVEQIADRSGYLGEGFQERFGSAIAHPEAVMSFRTVKGQDPDRIYESMEALGREEKVGVKKIGTYSAFATDVENEYAQAVGRGMIKGFNAKELHYKGRGGTIPVTSTFEEELQAPVILAGYGSPADSKHGPKESFLVQKGLYAGAQSTKYALEEIAQLRKAA